MIEEEEEEEKVAKKKNYVLSLSFHFSHSGPLLPLFPSTPCGASSHAGCSRIAWNSCVPLSALVSGRWPLGADFGSVGES